MLDEYRTLTNAGIINNTRGHTDLIEIDVAKAFTSSLASISEVPVAIKDINLYAVFPETKNLSLKKQVNIVNGKY